MTEAEDEAQITGFSIEHGHVGYLREAYHGAPYVTRYLVSEAFDSATSEAAISAATMRARLPAAVLMSMYREHKVYGAGDPSLVDLDQKGPTSCSRCYRTSSSTRYATKATRISFGLSTRRALRPRSGSSRLGRSPPFNDRSSSSLSCANAKSARPGTLPHRSKLLARAHPTLRRRVRTENVIIPKRSCARCLRWFPGLEFWRLAR